METGTPKTMKVRMKIGAYAGETRELRYDAAIDVIALGNAEPVNDDDQPPSKGAPSILDRFRHRPEADR